jgi:hypothetical protein
MADLWRDFWMRETGTGQQVAQLHDRYMMMMMIWIIRSFKPESCLFMQLGTAAWRLIVRSGLDVPTFATRRPHACHHARAPSGGRWNCGREMSGKFCLNADFHVTFRDLLHAVKLRHGTDGFTTPPKEGLLRIFFALKILRLLPGANPRTWVPKASTLPLDHRSRLGGGLLACSYVESWRKYTMIGRQTFCFYYDVI